MEISPYMLTLLLISSFLFGVSAGVLNDLNRIIRAMLGKRGESAALDRLYSTELPLVGRLDRKKKSSIGERTQTLLIFLGDILLFVYIGCGIAVLNYYYNSGEIRLYTFGATAAGFAAYYFTLGRLVMLLSEYIVFFIKAICAIVFHAVSAPFVFIFGIIKKIFCRAAKKIASALENVVLIRYNKRRMAKLLRLSREGFEIKM